MRNGLGANTITGVITNYRSNKIMKISRVDVRDFKITLPDDIWCLGVDQSTSCTGICIQNFDKTIQILLDLKRDRCLEKKDFYRDLFYLLRTIVTDKKVCMVITEKQLPIQTYASQVLDELKGHLDEYITLIPELSTAENDSIFPHVWKSRVMDKTKKMDGVKRSSIKRCIAEDISDRFYLLKDYFLNYPNKDYDSFDACGILNGYIEYAYTSDGYEKIHGTQEKTHTSLVGYCWVDTKDAPNVTSILGEYVDEWYNPVGLVYNSDYNLHDNIRIASSNYDCCYAVLPRDLLGQFMWKYGIDPEDKSKVMVMFVLRPGRFKNSEVKFFKACLEWNEEVFNK